jgi:flavorubredoxin
MVAIYEIGEGIFALTEYLPENSISVSSFLIMGDTPAIIETGTSYVANGFLRTLSDVIAPERISHVLVTHEHLDHIGGLPDYISEAYNAVVYAHKYIMVQLGFMGVVRGTIPISGGETISMGNRKIEVIYAPIETTGTVLYLVQPDGILFSGDYFGQLSEKKWTLYPEQSADDLVRDIARLHRGLGYTGESVRKYLQPLKKRKIRTIAPSHGSLIRENVDEVFDKVMTAKLD